jgi:hypothetical protein
LPRAEIPTLEKGPRPRLESLGFSHGPREALSALCLELRWQALRHRRF